MDILRTTDSPDHVADDVIAIIAKRVGSHPGELGINHRLDEMGLDSFAAVEMIFELEEKFDIEIPYNSNDMDMRFQTVGDVVEAIKKRVGQF